MSTQRRPGEGLNVETALGRTRPPAGGRLQPVSALPVAAFFLVAMVWGPRVHTRLWAKCPWCDHGRGGPDDKTTPSPCGPDGDERPRSVAVDEVAPAVTDGRQAVPDHWDDLAAQWEHLPLVRDPWLAPARSRRAAGPVPGQRRNGGGAR